MVYTVRVKKHFVFNELVGIEGQVIQLDEVLYARLTRAGYITDYKEVKSDTDSDTHQDSGISEPIDGSTGQDTPARRGNRRNK